jgi:hypothetical protein
VGLLGALSFTMLLRISFVHPISNYFDSCELPYPCKKDYNIHNKGYYRLFFSLFVSSDLILLVWGRSGLTTPILLGKNAK